MKLTSQSFDHEGAIPEEFAFAKPDPQTHATFAGNRNPVRDVMVGGTWLVEEGRHRDRDAVLAGYRGVMAALRD